MNTQTSTTCICGKKRNGLNSTNWTRHLDSCKKRKLQFSAGSITKFLKTNTNSSTSSSIQMQCNTIGNYLLNYNTTVNIELEIL